MAHAVYGRARCDSHLSHRYGYIEESKKLRTGLALGVFELGYVCSKLIAVAALGSASPTALLIFLLCELLAFLLVRVAIGNWRFYSAVGDSTGFCLVMHLGQGLLMLAAPFPVLRTPFVLTPSVYAGFIIWTLFGANPLMLAVAHYSFEARAYSATRLVLLIASTAVCAIGAACTLASVHNRFRATFYVHRTLAQHIRSYEWNERTVLKVNGEIDTDCDRELVRVRGAMSYARYYWPADLIKPFVRHNWCVARCGVTLQIDA